MMWLYVLGGVTAVVAAAFLLVRKTAGTQAKAPPQDAAKVAVRNAAERARAAVGTVPPPPKPSLLVLSVDPQIVKTLTEALDLTCTSVASADKIESSIDQTRPNILLVDAGLVTTLQSPKMPVIALLDAGTSRNAIVDLLAHNTSLAHCISPKLLSTTMGRNHVKNIVMRLAGGPEHDVLDVASVGRVAMLAQASQREARFQRLQEYFSRQNVSERTVSTIYEIAEELVMNALYNAPTEAGFFKAPVSRMEDVTLPLDRACEITYGVEGDFAFVRLRDTFGALRRDRLIEVLTRCSADGVTLDESRGGAGLGLWRVFSLATTVTIGVFPDRLTDVLVRVAMKQKGPKQLLAVDLFFSPGSEVTTRRSPAEVDELLDKSVTLLHRPS